MFIIAKSLNVHVRYINKGKINIFFKPSTSNECDKSNLHLWCSSNVEKKSAFSLYQYLNNESYNNALHFVLSYICIESFVRKFDATFNFCNKCSKIYLWTYWKTKFSWKFKFCKFFLLVPKKYLYIWNCNTFAIWLSESLNRYFYTWNVSKIQRWILNSFKYNSNAMDDPNNLKITLISI